MCETKLDHGVLAVGDVVPEIDIFILSAGIFTVMTLAYALMCGYGDNERVTFLLTPGTSMLVIALRKFVMV